MTNETGKVWLVGAGPGAAGLLTVRGRQLLDEADVVVHDALVSDELLSGLPAHKLIDAGKRAGSHTLPQPQISALLVEEARKGRRVVRLKGGDPFVFGRGGEELLALKEADVPFEVVPGVSSAFAAAAYVGIPVTHRGTSALVHVLTWHGKTAPPRPGTLAALARSGGTLVILMGAHWAAEIGKALIAAGYEPDTPAAVIESASTARQRKTVVTLQELASVERVEAPAVIVAGEVCRLGETLAWAHRMPLFGVRTVVTRPQPYNEKLCEKLRALGGEAIALPCIETIPLAVRPDKLARARDYVWLVFTSAAGVEAFFEAYISAGLDSRRLSGSRIAAIGPATAEALRQRGLIADYVPSIYDSKSLGARLAERMTVGEKALLIRAEEGAETLAASLSAGGAAYDELPVYRTELITGGRATEIVREGGFDYALFTSASTVRGFARSVPDIDFAGVHAVCIGEPTAQAAKELGMRVTVAPYATVESLCETLIRLKWEGHEYGDGI